MTCCNCCSFIETSSTSKRMEESSYVFIHTCSLPPKGHYVELNFSMHSYPLAPRPCLRDYYLEIRDGNNQSANVLGVFCGDHKTAVVRSSRRYLWLKFFPSLKYDFNGYYMGRSFNQTSKVFLDKLSTLKAIG